VNLENQMVDGREHISGELLSTNQGTLYPVLLSLNHKGAIALECSP
jgi:hypothetical protein